jgi:hypothetical protein
MAVDPISIGLGVAQAGIGTILGNNAAAKQKKAADKAVQKTQKSNKRQWRFDWRESKRQYKYQKESQEILKRNTEANLQFQDDSRFQEWEYGMGIRDYQFSQETRAYDESVNRATKQKSFNELAEEQAFIEQDRYLQETLIGIGFGEQQMMMDFAAANAGLEVKRGQAKARAGVQQAQLTGGAEFAKMRGQAEARTLKQRLASETELGIRTARTGFLFERQQGRIEALKAAGAAQAAGQAGRSARKVAQGIAAEAGAREAAGTEQFLLTEEAALQKQFFDVMGIDQQLQLDTMGINQKLMFDQQNVVQQLLFTEQDINLDLENLNNQLSLDKAQIAVTRDNLAASDTNVRRRINLQREQADIEAEASIRLKPEISPPLPKPMTLPRPEWQDVYKPHRGPEPIKGTAYTPNNTNIAALSSFGQVAQTAISGGLFDNLFGGGGNKFGGTSSFSVPSGSGLGISDSSIFNLNNSPFS